MKARRMAYGPIATRRIYERVRAMQVGEELTAKHEEWAMATPFADAIVKSPTCRDDYKVRELEGGKGWVVTRVN